MITQIIRKQFFCITSAINLRGRSGRGHCRKFSANFREISANFPQNFRTLSWRNKTHFFANFREFSAEFPQTFRKNPFAKRPHADNRCVCVCARAIGKLIPRQLLCAIGTRAESTLWKARTTQNNSCQKALCNRCPV